MWGGDGWGKQCGVLGTPYGVEGMWMAGVQLGVRRWGGGVRCDKKWYICERM